MAHAALVGALAAAPPADPRPLPPVVRVNLVSAPKRAPAPKPAARVAPRPAPAPKPRPAPAPKPEPVPRKKVLPKDPGPAKKPPKKVAPAPEPPAPEPLEYEDALAALRREAGEEEPAAPEEVPPELESSGSGQRIAPEVARWLQETNVAVRRKWIMPPEFRNKSLATLVRVRLNASGDVLGEPVVIRSSGNPKWDDNTIRAVVGASPLPPPPEPGEWEFHFSPEEAP